MTDRWYYWLTGWYREPGKPPHQFLVFGGNSEHEARQKGLETLSGIDFRIARLRTRNMAAASRMLKGSTLDRTRSIHAATRRLKHSGLRGRR